MSKRSVPFWASVRTRLVVVIFIAIAPALGLMFYTNLLSLGLLAGALAIAATWFSGGELIVRQVRQLVAATRRIAEGDFAARTNLGDDASELGLLARDFDAMADSLSQHRDQSERDELKLLHRAHQQTVVAALGHFALGTGELPALLEHAAQFVAQTLEVEYAGVFELQPDGQSLLLCAGTGWRPDVVGKAGMTVEKDSLAGFALAAGEPVVMEDVRTERRFYEPPLFFRHSILSGMHVVISGHDHAYGLLAAHTIRPRQFTEDEVHFLQAVASIIAVAVERRRVEANWHKLAAFARFNPNPVLEFRADGSLGYCNDAAQRIAARFGQESLLPILPPDASTIVRGCLQSGLSRLQIETRFGDRVLWWSFFPVDEGAVVHAYVMDITERVNLENQLRQAQKMESIGQLAAGVAHDFNNMLTVIQGHAGLLIANRERPGAASGAFDSAQAIFFAAERAAGLTRQLLMFSRKSVMQRQALDLRDLVRNMVKMLTRLLGETIHLEFNPDGDAAVIRGDTGMIEQTLMNLAVNARDAMTRGGTLTIETFPVELDEAASERQPEARPGTFVLLRVTDTGHGMDNATLSRIFEPFFTTKEVGKGTGLGLATVYAIVKQHEGWIEVASEVGRGTTFDVFFPALPVTSEITGTEAPAATQVRGGGETILLVEDEPVLLDLAHVILEDLGYRILQAPSGREALKVWQQHPEEVDLLLTDMVMPEGVTGKELAEQLTGRKPGLKVIYTSGYTGEEIERNGSNFLQKPYSRTTLARAVREVLDSN